MPSQAHHVQIRAKLFEFSRRYHAADTGHGEIHHHDVDIVESASLYRLGAIARFIDDFQISFSVDEELQSLTHGLVILNQQDTDASVHDHLRAGRGGRPRPLAIALAKRMRLPAAVQATRPRVRAVKDAPGSHPPE